MVKIKQFDSSVFCWNPRKAMEKFIQQNNISKNQIISMMPTTTNVGKSLSISYTLTYDDGQ